MTNHQSQTQSFTTELSCLPAHARRSQLNLQVQWNRCNWTTDCVYRQQWPAAHV